MVKLNKEQATYVYRYLASASLLELIMDYIVAKRALRNGEIKKLSK